VRTKLLTWFGVLLSAGIIAYIAFTFDLGDSVRAIALADPLWLVLAAALYLVLFPLRGLRWAVILRSIKPVSTSAATEVFAVGFLANNIMPARLGDVARAFVLAKREGVSSSSSFATVLLERVFDGLTVVGMLLLVLWIRPPSSGLVEGFAWIMAIAFPSAVFVAALVAWNEARAVALARAILSPLPDRISRRIVGILERLSKGLHTLRSAKATLAVLALSLAIWSIEVGVYLLAQRAFGLEVPTHGMVLVMAVLTLGLTMPSAPAFVGVFEGLVIAAVAVYGVGSTLGTAFALAMHLIHFIPGTLLGAFFTWRMGLRLRELRTVEATPSIDPPAIAVES
jgi:glycosyltransferase 2 family protein